MLRLHRATSIATGLLKTLLLGGCGEPFGTDGRGVEGVSNDLSSGELAIARGSCLHCRAASEAIAARIASMTAPNVTGKGSVALRLTPAPLERDLLDPAGVTPISRMPNVLHGLPESAALAPACAVEPRAFLREAPQDGKWCLPA